MDIGQISKCTYQVTHSSPLMITFMYLWPISRRIKHGNRDSCDHQRDGYLGRLCSSANDQFYALNALTGAIIWQTLLGTPTDQVIWSSPTFYKGSVYIGIASNDCPLVQAQVIQLNASTGAIQNTFNVVPNGCVGAGVWGLVTIDNSNGTLYFVTSNSGACSQAETNADDKVQLNTSDLAFMNSWQVPPAQQDGDLDFGSTPTLFTATIGGKVHSCWA